MQVKQFEDLEVWKEARVLSKQIYNLTNSDSFNNDWKLRSQMRDSSGSIMDNIAEGFERSGNAEFMHFLYISKGSAGELRSQLHRCLDIGYIDDETYSQKIRECESVSRKIHSLIKSLKSSNLKGAKYAGR